MIPRATGPIEGQGTSPDSRRKRAQDPAAGALAGVANKKRTLG